jgi:hypothetical protein
MDQKAAVVPGRDCFLTSALIVATLACNRVGIVEAPRGPEPNKLPPPFHLVWCSYNVETSESKEYGTRLEYSTKRIPDELVQDLLERVPQDWQRVAGPGLFTWQQGVNMVRGKLESQSMFGAVFRNADGRYFVISVGHDVRAATDKPTEARVLMVQFSADAVPIELSEASGAGLTESP